jgi:hypothetical protein
MAEGEKPVDEKVSHQPVRYVDMSPHTNERCGLCEHLIDTVPLRCQSVASPIRKSGWCVRFDPK